MYKTHNRKGDIHSKQKEKKVEKTPQRVATVQFFKPRLHAKSEKKLVQEALQSMIRTGKMISDNWYQIVENKLSQKHNKYKQYLTPDDKRST